LGPRVSSYGKPEEQDSRGETFVNFILWLIIGALAGWIASMIMKTNAQQGLLLDIIVGIIGAFIGGFVVSFFGIDPDSNLIISLITAVVGAVILLAIIKAVRRST